MKPPRPNAYRDRWAGQLRKGDVGSEVRVAGWIHRRRDHGGLIFVDLRDRTGLLQVVFRPEEAAEAHKRAEALRPEDVISVSGELVARAEGAVNPDLPTGEIELVARAVELLADAETPPFEIEEGGKEANEELRLKYRYLDLRRSSPAAAMQLRSEVNHAARQVLHDRGFLEIETPTRTRSTPEGARDFLVPARLKPGSWYALPVRRFSGKAGICGSSSALPGDSGRRGGPEAYKPRASAAASNTTSISRDSARASCVAEETSDSPACTPDDRNLIRSSRRLPSATPALSACRASSARRRSRSSAVPRCRRNSARRRCPSGVSTGRSWHERQTVSSGAASSTSVVRVPVETSRAKIAELRAKAKVQDFRGDAGL